MKTRSKNLPTHPSIIAANPDLTRVCVALKIAGSAGYFHLTGFAPVSRF
jgi:hypothetical protein